MKNNLFLLIFLFIQSYGYSKMLQSSNIDNSIKYFEHECETAHFTSLFDESKYHVKEYNQVTTDGYVLKVFRVRLQQSFLQNLPDSYKDNINQPVHIQHGLLGSADDHFINGSEKSYGHHFVNKGYDVWVGNNRGNKYSKGHTSQTITKDEFYDFSFQEMGLQDVPAFYDLILSNYADQSTKIIYVGQSQGTSQFFVAGADESTKDYITNKTSRFFALNPIAYMTYISSTQDKFLTQYQFLLYSLANLIHLDQLANWGCLNPNTLMIKGLVWACDTFKGACDQQDKAVVGDPTVNDVTNIFGTVITHVASGASAKSFAHYAQLISGDENGNPIFRAFDYGSQVGNYNHYKQTKPPVWTFTDWKIPTTMLTGLLSGQDTPQNIAVLTKQMDPSIYTNTEVSNWSHMTVFVARDPSPVFNIIDNALTD